MRKGFQDIYSTLDSGSADSHNGVMGFPRYSILEMHLGKFLDQWNFRAGKSTARLKYAPVHSFRDCQEIKKLRRFCHEEADKPTQSRFEELLMNQESPSVVVTVSSHNDALDHRG